MDKRIKHLVPPESWVENEDTLICPTCMAAIAHAGGDLQKMMENKARHRTYHLNIVEFISQEIHRQNPTPFDPRLLSGQ